MKRGDLVTVAVQGDYGKPRPALVIQSDSFSELDSVTVLLITSSLVEAPLLRVTVEPTEANGLRTISQVMIDKAMTIRRARLGEPFGALTSEDLLRIWRCLIVFLGG